MKKTLAIILFLTVFLSCQNQNEQIGISENPDSQGVAENTMKSRTVKISDLEFILQNINNDKSITDRINRLNYQKKFNGVYVTKSTDLNEKPISWITFTELGSHSMVSFKTSQIDSFDTLIKTLRQLNTLKEEREDKFKTKLIGDNYTYFIFKPENGINTILNEYDELIIQSTER